MLGWCFGYIAHHLQWKKHSGENNEMLYEIGRMKANNPKRAVRNEYIKIQGNLRFPHW